MKSISILRARFGCLCSLVVILWPSPCVGQDEEVYGLFRGVGYTQSGEGQVAEDLERGFFLQAWVKGVPPAGAVLRPPGGETRALAADASDGADWLQIFADEDARDAAYPNGDYTIERPLEGEALRVASLPLPSGPFYVLPMFGNVALMDAAPPGEDYPLLWAPMNYLAGPDDLILLVMEDVAGNVVFHTPWPGQTGALAPSAFHAMIPGNLLHDGDVYTLRLSFCRCVTVEDGVNYRVRAGQIMTTSTTLSVRTAPLGPATETYQISLGSRWTQATDAAPVPLAGAEAYAFEARAHPQWQVELTDATVETPQGETFALAAEGDGVDFVYAAEFASKEALDAVSGAGNYIWSITGLDRPEESATLEMPAGDFPAAPRIVGLEALQGADLRTGFDVNWEAEDATLENDAFELDVIDAIGTIVWRRPDPNDGGSSGIDGDERSCSITPNAIKPAPGLQGRLRRVHIEKTADGPMSGATGLARRFAETRFPFPGTASVWQEILNTELAPAVAGEAYRQQLVVAGGNAPRLWSVASGALPPGLTLTSDGLVSGTPLDGGSYQVVFALTEASGATVELPWTFEVSGEVPPLDIVDDPLPAPAPGRYYFVEMACNGGIPPFTWSLADGRLPRGLELQDCCGIIAGDLAEAGQFSFTLEVVDARGDVDAYEAALTVPFDAVDTGILLTDFWRGSGGQCSVGLDGEPGLPYTIEASSDLLAWKTVAQITLSEAGLLAWTDPEPAASRFFRARMGWDGPEPDPLTVEPILDDAFVARGIPDESGLTLQLTDGFGVQYVLSIPPSAIVGQVEVTMTALADVAGLPLSGGFVGGVELQPDGLALQKSATLTLTAPNGIPADATSFSYDGDGHDCHLTPAWRDGGSLVLPIQHFSGHGSKQGSKNEANAMSSRAACLPMYRGEQNLAWVLRQSAPDWPPDEAMRPVMDAWYKETVIPNLKKAETDDSGLDAAMAEFMRWSQLMQSIGLAEGFDSAGLASLGRGLINAINRAETRCSTNFDPSQAEVMIERLHQMQLLGIDPGFGIDALYERIRRCWRFELTLESLVDVDGGAFFEQVRSGRCVFEFDPATLGFTQCGTATVDLVFWHLDASSEIKPSYGSGTLDGVFLHFEKAEKPEPSKADPCPKPPAGSLPISMTCIFHVTDPINGMLVQKADGGWQLVPLGGDEGGRWLPLFKIAHYDTIGDVPDPFPNGSPTQSFTFADGWEIVGGRLYARLTFSGEIALSGGKATEATTLDLWHAPLPKRGN